MSVPRVLFIFTETERSGKLNDSIDLRLILLGGNVLFFTIMSNYYFTVLLRNFANVCVAFQSLGSVGQHA